MKTLYFETDQFVRREGNVIDFTEYRQRMASAADPETDECLTWEEADSLWPYDEEAEPDELALSRPHRGHPSPRPRAARSRRRHQDLGPLTLADLLEVGASCGIVVVMVTIWFQFLI